MPWLPLPGLGLGLVSLLWFLPSVDSNDSLYGGDSKFLAENNKLCETVMAQILEHLKTLAKDEVGAPGHLASSKGAWTLVCPVSTGSVCRPFTEGPRAFAPAVFSASQLLLAAPLILHISAQVPPQSGFPRPPSQVAAVLLGLSVLFLGHSVTL